MSSEAERKSPPARKKTVKSCPECRQQVPTACKSCPCGFIYKRMTIPIATGDNKFCGSKAPVDPTKRRRTERVKKEPHYFNAMEYEHHTFKRRRRTASSSSIASSTTSDDATKKKKNRSVLEKVKEEITETKDSGPSTPTGSDKERDRASEEDLYTGLTVEKALQYSIILAHINKKFSGQNFQPT